jgi:hypothetical protein
VIDELLQSPLLNVKAVPQGPILLGRTELWTNSDKRTHCLLMTRSTYFGWCDRLREADEGQRQVDETVLVFLDVLFTVDNLHARIRLAS